MDNMDSIYRSYAQTVYKFLLAQCRDPDLAEELTQETFYQAVRSIGRFDGSCKVSTWLCQIAKHLWYQHLRKHRREAPLPEELPATPAPSAEEGLLAQEDFHFSATLKAALWLHSSSPAAPVLYRPADSEPHNQMISISGLSHRDH